MSAEYRFAHRIFVRAFKLAAQSVGPTQTCLIARNLADAAEQAARCTGTWDQEFADGVTEILRDPQFEVN